MLDWPCSSSEGKWRHPRLARTCQSCPGECSGLAGSRKTEVGHAQMSMRLFLSAQQVREAQVECGCAGRRLPSDLGAPCLKPSQPGGKGTDEGFHSFAQLQRLPFLRFKWQAECNLLSPDSPLRPQFGPPDAQMIFCSSSKRCLS